MEEISEAFSREMTSSGNSGWSSTSEKISSRTGRSGLRQEPLNKIELFPAEACSEAPNASRVDAISKAVRWAVP